MQDRKTNTLSAQFLWPNVDDPEQNISCRSPIQRGKVVLLFCQWINPFSSIRCDGGERIYTASHLVIRIWCGANTGSWMFNAHATILQCPWSNPFSCFPPMILFYDSTETYKTHMTADFMSRRKMILIYLPTSTFTHIWWLLISSLHIHTSNTKSENWRS